MDGPALDVPGLRRGRGRGPRLRGRRRLGCRERGPVFADSVHKSGFRFTRTMIMHLSEIISELDIAIMTADQKISRNYIRPKVLNNKHFVVEDGRHPVIESLDDFASIWGPMPRAWFHAAKQ